MEHCSHCINQDLLHEAERIEGKEMECYDTNRKGGISSEYNRQRE